MSKLNWINAAPIVLACWGMLVPTAELRAEEAAETMITDVALDDSGSIGGVVVDGQGEPVDGATVKVRSKSELVGTTVANDKGEFSIAGLSGGLHMVMAPQGSAMVRVWTKRAAPPAAKSRVTIVSDTTTVRGNCADGSCGLGGLLGHGIGGGLLGHGGGGILGHGGYSSPAVTGGGYWSNGAGSMFGDTLGGGFSNGGGIMNGGVIDGGFSNGGFMDGGFANGGFVDGGFSNGGFVDGGFGGGFSDGGFGGGFVDGGFGGAHYCPPGTVPVYSGGGGGGLFGLGALGGLGGSSLLTTAALIGGTVAISAAVAEELDDDDPPASP